MDPKTKCKGPVLSRKYLWNLLLLVVAFIGAKSYQLPSPQFSLLSSGGLRMSIREPDSQVKLIAIHYSINRQLSGTRAGQWNYDINHNTNGVWTHENTNLRLKTGDTVYYWLYALRNGLGYPVLNKEWRVPGGVRPTQRPLVTRPPTRHPTQPTRPPENNVQISNDPLSAMLSAERGLTIKVRGSPDTILVGVHYSINQQLPGTRAGQYNYDILKRTGTHFVHTNSGISLKAGDRVNYWIYVLGPNGGRQRLNQIWTVQKGNTNTNRPTQRPINPVTQKPAQRPFTTQKIIKYTGKEANFKPGFGCPDKVSNLRPLTGGSRVTIGAGEKRVISRSTTLHSLVIKDRGILVVADVGSHIELRVRSIFIYNGGEFHVGSESCRYQGRFTITLLGRSGEGPKHNIYGEKHLAVGSGGVLEIHGQKKLSWTLLNTHVEPGIGNPVISLEDDVSSWRTGDRIVISSTDYDMEQTEEFDLIPCSSCNSNQVRLQGSAKWLHWGAIYKGVDMRAEVGVLTRNIVIRGEVQNRCYGNNWCQYFKQDTFGGHLMVTSGFKSLHISGVELTQMGQQQVGRYPIHFHMAGDVDEKGGYTKPTYVREISMHHNFHRCVTIHGTNGLLVKDTIGYDTFGHCYFLEDGAERRNVLDHNLGMITKPGTVLPSDRDSKMCKEIRTKVCCGYVPDINNCNGVSTFWIAHPQNTLINNAAAGATQTGYWYIFHHEPSGLSKGQLPAFHSSRAAITEFRNNRAHSNKRLGLMIDGGVKVSESKPGQPQEFLAMWGGIYTPHKNQDLSQPREAAVIDKFIAFKNGDGTWVRGGEIHFTNSQFADNTYSVTLASGGTYPPDFGSHQEVRNSIFIGESPNRGSKSPGNRNWGPGSDGRMRTHSSVNSHPMFGVRIYDGPMGVYNCHFDDYFKTDFRKSSAFGFFLNNPFLMTPYNQIEGNTFGKNTYRVFVSAKANFFNNADRDGDKTCILWDKDGSASGIKDSYIVRPDNYLVHNRGRCVDKPDWSAKVCDGGHAANLYFRVSAGAHSRLSIRRDDFSSKSVSFTGLGGVYMPVVMLERSYTVHWQSAAPSKLEMEPIMFNKGQWLQLGLCYPGSPRFRIHSEIRDWGRLVQKRDFRSTNSLAAVRNGSGDIYYYDHSAGLLFIKVRSDDAREYWNFCGQRGCLKIHIEAMGGGGVGDCVNRAYPKYAT